MQDRGYPSRRGLGSSGPRFFLHDQNCHTFTEALKRPIWLSWTEYAESNRAGEGRKDAKTVQRCKSERRSCGKVERWGPKKRTEC
jgi:hypothetical protein